MEIRRGGMDDVPTIMGMLDGAVSWLAARGRADQWGTRPWSEDPGQVEKIADKVRTGVAWIAEVGGEPAGAMILSAEPVDYVPAAGEPELYITLLVTSQAFTGHGVGSTLLAHAYDEARSADVGLLRVDCFAGNDGRLVEYYRGNGFTKADTFTVGTWPGQILFREVTPS